MSESNQKEKIVKLTRNINLLYVEDEPTIRDLTCSLLESYFDTIYVAKDGKEGLELFKNKSIDLIITDIQMPNMDGFTMIQQIRKINEDVEILILSAHNDVDYFLKSFHLGVDGYLLKPIEIDQFHTTLKRAAQRVIACKREKEYQVLLEQYRKVIDGSAIASKTDSSGKITYVNDKFCELSGYSREELIGKNHNIIRHPDTPPEIFKQMWKTIKKKKKCWHGIIKNRTKEGKSYFVDTTIKPLIDENGKIIEFIALRNDITEIMNPKKQLDSIINSAENPIVILIRLEDFDILEEFYDDVILERAQDKIAKHLELQLPKSCLFEKVYRLGHGEYALAQEKEGVDYKHEHFLKQMKQFIKNVQSSEIDLGGVEYKASILLSYAMDEHPLESAKLGIKTLLKEKKNLLDATGLAREYQEKAKKNIETVNLIKYALENLRIISYFQPIIDNRTQKIVKYESLVRLINQEGKVLSPYFFLNIAKKGKYYLEITKIVLENSFGALQHTNMEISINLSALDIEDEEMRSNILLLLEKHKKDAKRIVFELLEDERVGDMELIKNFISQIKSYGVQIAIDDFGAGYSNFERLLDYQPDILKIDGSIIKNIETSQYSLSVLKAIVTFAQANQIKTIAEFVENESIFHLLQDAGVDYSQGYFFGKPTPLEEIQKVCI